MYKNADSSKLYESGVDFGSGGNEQMLI